jgi:hypothetical protein
VLKTGLAILLTTVLAVGGGAWSLARVLDNAQGTGALTIGSWTAFPKIGSPDADPYSKARTSREGILALGSAEGIAFSAATDSAGNKLRAECSYRIEGSVPTSRFWTLAAITEQPPPEKAERLPALNSQSILRTSDSSFAVTVTSHPAPGNWLVVAGVGPMSLLLTVYDSNIATGSEFTEIAMPRIEPLGCDA